MFLVGSEVSWVDMRTNRRKYGIVTQSDLGDGTTRVNYCGKIHRVSDSLLRQEER